MFRKIQFEIAFTPAVYYSMIIDSIMVQKREFNQFFKQKILSVQKHKCKKCGKKFSVSNLPEFGYSDGNVRNNDKNNIQALCQNCFSEKE